MAFNIPSVAATSLRVTLDVSFSAAILLLDCAILIPPPVDASPTSIVTIMTPAPRISALLVQAHAATPGRTVGRLSLPELASRTQLLLLIHLSDRLHG
jgi:hypothetical protein